MIYPLLADADLKRAIVSGVVRQNPAIDFKRAEDVPLEGLADNLVLTIAAEQGRVLISHDVSTMRTHFREFVHRRTSPGLILIPQSLSVGTAIESLLLICGACNESDLQNRMCLVPSLQIVEF